MEKIKVFLTEMVHSDAYNYLAERYEVILGTDKTSDVIINEAVNCVGMLVRTAKIDVSIMEKLPSLKVIARHGVGVDGVDLNAADRLNIAVVNAPYSMINSVAEHTIAMMLAVSKNIPFLDKAVRNDQFSVRMRQTNREISGKTIGLIGFGRIGSRVAEMLSCFGVEVLAYDPLASEKKCADEKVTFVDFETVLCNSDYISLHLPLLAETQHLINAEAFSLMKKSAFFVNCARGPLVDENALFDALKNEKIAGAAIDVFDVEPPSSDNPLLKLDNIIVSPHMASLTDNSYRAMGLDAAKGIFEILSGEPASFPVNRTAKEFGGK